MQWKEAATKVPEAKDGSGYMKFKVGANKFRILSEPIMGWEYWTEDSKSIRVHEYPSTIPADIRKGEAPKFFWAFVVWNFTTKAVEILEITQRTIIEPMQELIGSEEWGDPTGYSITVNRSGSDKESTTYSVVPSPAQATPAEVLQAYKDKPINLDALFDGGNPFEVAA